MLWERVPENWIVFFVFLDILHTSFDADANEYCAKKNLKTDKNAYQPFHFHF